MYWPQRGPETTREKFTTYGKTIGMSAKLSAADRKALTAQVYRDRHDAFMKMLARQHELQQAKAADMSTVMYSHNPGPYLSKSKSATHLHQTNRSKEFMAPSGCQPGHSLTTTPLDVALYHAPSSDPFVPNNSYKEHIRRSRQRAASSHPLAAAKDINEDMLPVHRLYRSSGGYDDTVKASNHIKQYRPDIQDISEYKVRQGRNGGAWRHVKEVMQGKGKRIMFVDGITSIDDLARVKTNMILGGVRTPKPLSARLTDSYTKYEATPAEIHASEGVNWNVMR